MRGEGEGERNRIFAEAFEGSQLLRVLPLAQAYAASMGGEDTTMVLSPDSAFFAISAAGRAAARQ